jgi:integrase
MAYNMGNPALKLVEPITENRTVVVRRPPNAELRSREYLTPAEVDRLVEAAKSNRWPLRDATMVLVGYRHGLRAKEVVELEWDQVDFAHSTLSVRRAKGGKPSAHPLQGDTMRALRKLRKDNPHGKFVFVSEREDPFTEAGFAKMIERLGRRPPLRSIRTCYGMPAVTSWRTTARIPVRCKPILDTRIFNTPSATPN